MSVEALPEHSFDQALLAPSPEPTGCHPLRADPLEACLLWLAFPLSFSFPHSFLSLPLPLHLPCPRVQPLSLSHSCFSLPLPHPALPRPVPCCLDWQLRPPPVERWRSLAQAQKRATRIPAGGHQLHRPAVLLLPNTPLL